MKIQTRVTFNAQSIMSRVKAANKSTLNTVAMQALKDSNQYCPEDQEDLVNSSLVNSDIKNGILRWATKYARYQYYGVAMEGRAPKVKTDRPLKYTKQKARKMWAHYARDIHGKEWKKVYQSELRRLLSK